MGANVLVVEDELLIAHDIRSALLDFGYEVPAVARSGYEALDAVVLAPPDLVLMDIHLEGPLDGIDTAARLQERCPAAIVYLTSHSDEATFARARETRPYGYIVKPFTDRELRISVEVALGRRQLDLEAASAHREQAHRELLARSEEHRRESDRLLAAARTDPLTEAGNRLRLQEDLEAIADRARRYGHVYCAAFCDIDGLKIYNDSLGHLAGDDAIRIVSRAIQDQLRRSDSFYRYGGDEFLVLLPEQSLATAKECMERVRGAVAALPVTGEPGGLADRLTLSVGVAELRGSRDGDAIRSWLQRADTALYRAKAQGRNRVVTDGGPGC